jgi:hypothetical protein
VTKDEVLKMALEALELSAITVDSFDVQRKTYQAIMAVKEALAQPAQEPVAWMDAEGDVLSANTVDGTGLRNIPLYTTPPQRPWVKLTDEEVERIKLDGRDLEFVSMTALHRFARDIQAKLKEKNAP